MTEDIRNVWAGVGDRVESLALKLKLHAEEDLGELGALVDSMRDVARDPAVREDVREVAAALRDAVETTVARTRTSIGGGR